MSISHLSPKSGNMAKLAVLSFLATGVISAAPVYQLDSIFAGGTFFDGFDFATGPDPNGGYVAYQDYQTASTAGLVAYDGNTNFLLVDSTNLVTAGQSGRSATKLVSKQTYNHGLFIAEMSNMPGGICGTVPGYYIGGGKGRISTISGSNDAVVNTMTMLTTGPYDVVGNNGTGTQQTTSCQTGCSTVDDYYGYNLAYGDIFNYNSGGVFATLWDSNGVSIWFWASIDGAPVDAHSTNPDPSGWGAPVASFTGASSVDGILSNGKIVFDSNFCGPAVESIWQQSPCYDPVRSPTCQTYVANNPADFGTMYWAINSVMVFQNTAAAGPSPSSSSSAAASSTPAPIAASSTQVAAPATSSAAPGSGLPDVNGYAYHGCVKDIDTRILTNDHLVSDPMTLETCAAFCSSYPFFGLEYTHECYCGDMFQAPLVTVPDSQCNDPCTGDTNQMCGGSMLLSVYTNAAVQFVSPVVSSSSSLQPAASSSTSVLSSSSTESSVTSTSTSETSSSSAISSSSSGTSSTLGSSTSSSIPLSSESSVLAAPMASALPAVPSDSSSTLIQVTSSSSSSSSSPSSTASVMPSSSPISSVTNSIVSSSVDSSSAMISQSPIVIDVTTTLYTTSTVFSTSTYTVTSCLPEVTNCPVGSIAVTTFPVSTTVFAVPMSTSTAYTTIVQTILSCAPTVTNCPVGSVTTRTLPISSSIIPITTPAPEMTTSTVYATKIYTVTSCAETVINCPARLGQVTTEIISLYTTVCPVAQTPADTYTTVIVATYVDVCSEGLTTRSVSQTQTLVRGAPGGTIPMVMSTATVTLGGKTKTLTLSVPDSTKAAAAVATGANGDVGAAKPAANPPAVVGASSNPAVVVIQTTMVVVPVQTPVVSTCNGNGCGSGSGNSTNVNAGAPKVSNAVNATSAGMGSAEWSAAAVLVGILAGILML